MLRRLLSVLALCLACSSAAAATVSFNDPGKNQQWYLDALNFGDAWGRIMDLPERGKIKVAVVDSGFDTDHTDLQRNLAMRRAFNVVDRSTNIGSSNTHGTGTIGLMAATSGNGTGISQAAWTSRAIPVRASNRADGAAYTTHLAAGIRYAADAGARVINVSYSGVHLGILQKAALYAQTKGAVVFMSAGNTGKTHGRWRNHKQLIAVGSTDPDGRVSSFSSRGEFVDLVAPGRNILSLTTKGRTYNWSGTSFSSPIAASVAALMLTANPELAPWQVRKILRQTSQDIGAAGVDPASGYGLINADAAVAAAIATEGRYTGEVAGKTIRYAETDLRAYSGLRLVSQLQAVTDVYPNQGTAVPEPGTLVLMLAGHLAVHGSRTRRKEIR